MSEQYYTKACDCKALSRINAIRTISEADQHAKRVAVAFRLIPELSCDGCGKPWRKAS